jgi:hypothetical protein
MTTVKIKLEDGSVTVEGLAIIKVTGVESNKVHLLKLEDDNKKVESYEFDGVIIRPNRPPR